MNGRKLIVLLLAVLALAAAGCGGDDSNEAGGDTAVVEETTTEDTTAEETTVEETTEETGTTDDDAVLSGKCVEFAGLGAKISEAASEGDAGLEEAAKLFDELASQVPDEIKADFEVISENFSKLAEGLKGIDLTSGAQPSPEDLAKLQELTASLDSAEVQQASANIEKWVAENC